MKRFLVFTLFSPFVLSANAQYSPVNRQLPVVNVYPSSHIRPGGIYRQSFSTQSVQSATLHLRLRRRFSVKHVLKAVTPFAAASSYGVIKQRDLLSYGEGRQGHFNPTPALTGGLLLSGNNLRHKKAYIELSYRNASGSLLRTEKQWIDVQKETSIHITNPPTGFVDVSLMAPRDQGLQIQEMSYQAITDTTTVDNGGATTNKQQPIDGGTLPEVVVYGQGSGGGYSPYAWQDLLTNFADATSIQVNNPYGGTYGGGGGGSGSFGANSSSSGPSTDNNRDYDQENKCGGLAKMIALSTQSGTGNASKEVFAVLTGDGTLVIFPMNGNTADNANVPGTFGEYPTFDPQTGQQTGTQINYARKTAAGITVISNVVATYHTHQRCLEDGCSGDRPSAAGTNSAGTDEDVARALPQKLTHYTLGCCGTWSYGVDQYGNFNSQQSSQYIDDNGNPFTATDANSLGNKTGNACP